MGYSPYYIYILFKKYSKDIVNINSSPIITGISNFMVNKKLKLSGLRSGENIESMYNEIALRKGIKTIRDIQMPIVIPAVDITESKEYVFTNCIPENEEKSKYITDITIGKAVRASSSFPAVFCPCDFESHKFLDGGALDNIPVHEVKKQGADKVIAVNFDADAVDDESNIMDIAMKTIDIMGNKISEENLQNSDMVLTIQTDKTGLLEVEKLDKCYEYGYNQTINNLDKILKLVNETK